MNTEPDAELQRKQDADIIDFFRKSLLPYQRQALDRLRAKAEAENGKLNINERR